MNIEKTNPEKELYDFTLVQRKNTQAASLSRPSLSFWQDAWRRFKKNKQALLSLILAAALSLFVLLGPFLWNIDPKRQGTQVSSAPSQGELAIVTENEISDTPIFIEAHPATPVSNIENPLSVQNLRTEGLVTTQGVKLIWNPVEGASSYSIYRSDLKVDSGNFGLPLGETSAGNQVSYFDTGSLEPRTYHYTIVAKNLNGVEGSNYSTLSVNVSSGLTLDQAKEFFPDARVGDQVKLNATPFGTDSLGRDMLARIMYGGRISLFIGVFAALFEVLIGIMIGGISGYYGGRLDNYIMRATDFVMGLPFLLFMILLKVAMGVGPGESGISAMIVALVVLSWPGPARLVRGQILQLRESEFISAARLMGARPRYLLTKHLIPNVMGNILVAVTFGIPSAIFTEAWLSFIGLGVASPAASWGSMSSEALQSILIHPHEFFLPSIFIAITVLAFNLLGDGLRDALDPKMRSNE